MPSPRLLQVPGAVPEFIAPVGKYDWLNRNIFVARLTELPAALRLAAVHSRMTG